jgi:hypothetical protein
VISMIRSCLDCKRVLIKTSDPCPHDSWLETESWSLFHGIPFLRWSYRLKGLYLFLFRGVIGVWLGHMCATTIGSWGSINRLPISLIIRRATHAREACIYLLWLAPDNVEAWHCRWRCNVLDWRWRAGLTLSGAIWDKAPMLSCKGPRSIELFQSEAVMCTR